MEGVGAGGGLALYSLCLSNFSTPPLSKNSFFSPPTPAPNTNSNSFFYPLLFLTLCHSHHRCLTFGVLWGGWRLCCYTAPICPTSLHAVDHDAASTAGALGTVKTLAGTAGALFQAATLCSSATTCAR